MACSSEGRAIQAIDGTLVFVSLHLAVALPESHNITQKADDNVPSQQMFPKSEQRLTWQQAYKAPGLSGHITDCLGKPCVSCISSRPDTHH